MELSELYRWIDDDPTHGLILQITDSEIDMLKLGKEAMQTFIEKKGYYTNDHIVEVYNLIDKISEVGDTNSGSEVKRVICSSCGQLIDPYFHTCNGMNNYLFESNYKD